MSETQKAPLFVDNSLLSSVDCSTDLALSKIHSYTSIEGKAAINAGKAAHSALDNWFQHKDKLAAMALFESEYRDYADEFITDPDNRLTYENTSAILDNWLDTKGIDLVKDVEIIPGFVEVGFAYPLGVDIGKALSGMKGEFSPEWLRNAYKGVPGVEFVMCGRFDMLVRWKGQIYVWENKTTGSVNFLKETLRFSSQLSGYLWAAKKMVAQSTQPMATVNVSGVIVNAIEFRKMAGSDRRCSQHGMKYSECKFYHLGHAFLGPMGRSPEMLVEWEKTALNLAKRYRDVLAGYRKLSDVPKLRTQGQFIYNRCPNCTFNNFCLAGRPIDAIDSMLRVDPWSPFDDVIQDSQNLFLAGEVVVKR